ncbi:DNA cytosine methyltransferase [Fusobacterium varium]|uniref:DNA cytosine methyltransferase n=1 Tax=Fusobacterium TaxID=848 RepID=UPI0030D4EA60
MKVIELFAGVGSQTQALKNLGIKHEVIGISEIDKYAINSYEQLHGTVNNFGDISKIDILPTADLWTYSFPCQDISVSGKQRGFDKEDNTRSGLLWEVERLLKASEKPKYLLMENVKNLISKKFKPGFDKWCECLEEMGYTNYYQVLNAKDFGVPQNRERVFMVSILGEHKPYLFPQKQETNIKFKDIAKSKLEVPEHILKSFYNKKGVFKERFKTNKLDYSMCLTTKGAWSSITNNFYTDDYKKYTIKDIVDNNIKCYVLTPKECWRLMGWKDEQFEKIQGISNTQLYKQAGNGIVVIVLEAIFKNLFQEQENKCENCEKYNNFLCGKNGNYILPTMEIVMNCNR